MKKKKVQKPTKAGQADNGAKPFVKRLVCPKCGCATTTIRNIEYCMSDFCMWRQTIA
jgi:hypothetical protein